MKYFIPLLLLPCFVHGQQQKPVEPVESADYLNLVKKQRVAVLAARDSSMVQLRLSRSGYYPAIGGVKITGDRLTLYPANFMSGWLSGSLSTTVEFRLANKQPSLQNSYTQGRSANGALHWQGAETGEPFSFGPALGALAFDGSAYPYDGGGRLVPAGSGTGRQAQAYNNDILRTASYLSQHLSLNGGLRSARYGTWLVNTALGYSRENTFIRNNRNKSNNLSTSLTRQANRFEFTAAYKYLHDEFTNPNRNGFLNRAYMNALLTPASFDNSYSPLPYAAGADNPLSLLKSSGNSYAQTQQTGSLLAQYRQDGRSAKILQSYSDVAQNSREAYAPRAASFPGGITTQRNKSDRSYYLKADVSLPLPEIPGVRHAAVEAFYILTDNRSRISYMSQQQLYQYQRTTNELQVRHSFSTYTPFEISADISNTFYFSNTASKTYLFLPAVNLRSKYDIPDTEIGISFFGSFQVVNNELPLQSSLAHVNLLQFASGDFTGYFPMTEVSGYDQLLAVNNRNYSAKLVLRYQALLALSGEWFRKEVRNDVFPLLNNGQLHLQNMAGHRRQGFELELSQYRNVIRERQLTTGNTLSFVTYTHRITQVSEGLNYTPIAGFSDVHKVVAQGENMGAIMGSAYLRDAAGNKVIGADGFPLADPQKKIIGNPIPDFVLKLSNELAWKRFSLTTDVEWKKGGQLWDGTQAILDYYGRSATSAALRNTTGYVFEGATQNGHPNTIPVSFYDPAKPFDENRWVRYGFGGVAEDYIRKADHLRLNRVELGYYWKFKKGPRKIVVAGYATNVLLWSELSGRDPNQLLLDQPAASGLDFFNLPSTRTYGCHLSLQF